MALQKGDFILINLTAKVKETNEVFDTTNEETAKKEHLTKEGEIYETRLVVVGEGWVLKALDESLVTMEPNKPATIEIPPDKAFGARDPEKTKLVSMKKLAEKGINAGIGARIEFGGKNATIRSMGAGRALLDFNAPLAGKTLVYDVTVEKKLDANEEKIAALIHRRIPVVEQSKFQFTLNDKIVTIDMPEDTFYVEGVQIAKRGIAMDLQKFFPETTIKFIETFKAVEQPKPAEAKPPEAKPAAEAKPETETKPES
jgi:peptidylprolyl isomerase